MLLTADVGNTNIKLGVFDGDKLTCKIRFSTDTCQTSDEFAVELYAFFQIYKIDSQSITSSIISSVVPKVTYSLKTAIQTVTRAKSFVVGPGLKTGLNIKIEHPKLSERILLPDASVRAQSITGSLIMIFMGTATAIAYVDENHNYYGGAIAPGVGISLDALTRNGALLSSVDLKAPGKSISSNTTDCIRSGVMFGTACMLDGMIDRFVRETKKECTVIATGGLAPLMIKNCTHKIVFDENIILDGLNYIYKRNKK